MYGHDDHRLDAEQRRRERDALGVVAGGGGDDSTGGFIRRQRPHPRVGAADLERVDWLAVLALDLDGVAEALGE